MYPDNLRKEGCAITPSRERKAKWQNDYVARKYDRLNIFVPAGQRALVERAALEAQESMNQFTNRALLQRMGLEEWPKEEPPTDE